jgi:hypothetical protein
MVDVTLQCVVEILRENEKETTVICGQPMFIGATCTKCGLETSLRLSGTKFLCQNCGGTSDPPGRRFVRGTE